MDTRPRDCRVKCPMTPVAKSVVLPGGRSVVIRPASADDIDGLGELFGSLSIEDQLLRFFSVHRPDRAFFERIVTLAERGVGDALVVETLEGSGRIVAEADYVNLADGDAEFSIVVADGWRGGLGRALLDALLDVAAQHGIPNLQAEILLMNRRMIGLLRHRPWAVLSHAGLDSFRISIATLGSMPTWPRADRKRILVEARGARWNYEADAVGSGFAVAACGGPVGCNPSSCPVLGSPPTTCGLAAEADLIVVGLPPDDPSTGMLLEAHRRLHPHVPVCIEASPRDASRAGETGITRDMPAGDVIERIRNLVNR